MSGPTLENLELRAVSAVQALRLRCEELSADVERLTAENKTLKINVRQMQGELDIERKLRDRERKEQTKAVLRAQSQARGDQKEWDAGIEKLKAKSQEPKDPLHKLTLGDKILLCLFRVDAPLTRNQITFYTGLSPTSGPMCAAYAQLLEQGLIGQSKKAGPYELTDSGAEHLAELELHAPPMPGGSEIFSEFCKREGGVVETMVRALRGLSLHEPHTRQEIADHASELVGRTVSATSGPACAAFGRLKKLGVIQQGRGITFSPWVVGIVEPISVKVRDTTTGAERRVTVK